MSEFKPGDRVKVEFESTVLGESVYGSAVSINHPRGGGCMDIPISALTKLPDPEPEWRKGDVVRWDTFGVIHTSVRQKSDAWSCSCGSPSFNDGVINRAQREGRLTVLHREDQP